LQVIPRLWGFAVKRADELCVGDIIVQDPCGFFPSKLMPEFISVHTLQLTGDDVVVNEGLTTSQGNCVLVLYNHKTGDSRKSWEVEWEYDPSQRWYTLTYR
jgi:hypothetical protein